LNGNYSKFFLKIFIHKISVKQKVKTENNSVSCNQSKENNDEFNSARMPLKILKFNMEKYLSQEKIFFSQNPSENNSNGKPLRNNDGKTPYACLRTKAQGIYKTKLGRDITKRHGSPWEQLDMLWAARV